MVNRAESCRESLSLPCKVVPGSPESQPENWREEERKMLSSWKGSREIQVDENPLVQRGLEDGELQNSGKSFKRLQSPPSPGMFCVWATIKGARWKLNKALEKKIRPWMS